MAKSKLPESLFAVSITLKSSLLGDLIAFLDNRAESLDVKIIKEIGEGRNIKRGAARDFIREFLAKGKKPIAELRSAMKGAGFTTSSINNAIFIANRDKIIRKDAAGMVILLGRPK